MTLPIQKPRFADPPDEYDKEYMSQLLRQLDTFFTKLNAPGSIQATTIHLSQLPTAATGLKAGDLWNDLGTVKIVS